MALSEHPLMQQANTYALKRFALKLSILICFTSAQWRSGLLKTGITLSLLTAFADVAIALLRRQRITASRFTYWDEAAMFVLISLSLVAISTWAS